MHWILQDNIYSEEGFTGLVNALTRLEVPYSIVKVVPFVGEIVHSDGPELPESTDRMVMGSYSLARMAVKNGWKPGAYLDNLDFRIQLEHWGDLMLNSDAQICDFVDVPFQPEPFFIRPVHDTKAFTGLVTDWGYYSDWRANLLRLPETADPEFDPLGICVLTPQTPTMVCKKKEIYSETRMWIVHEQIVTASQYKIGTLKRYEEVRGSRFDTPIIEFAADCAAQWSPNDAYVMDVADTPDGFKIIEINNLNSAGFYKADMNKLVAALEGIM